MITKVNQGRKCSRRRGLMVQGAVVEREGRKKSRVWSVGEDVMVARKNWDTRWLRSRSGSGRWVRIASRSSGVERTRWHDEGIVVVWRGVVFVGVVFFLFFSFDLEIVRRIHIWLSGCVAVWVELRWIARLPDIHSAGVVSTSLGRAKYLPQFSPPCAGQLLISAIWC
jgi:hypothetical protein